MSMFKIMKGATFVALSRQVAQLPGLRQQIIAAQEQAAAAQQEAETARADADRVRVALKAIEDDRVLGLAALRDAVRDPVRAPSIRGLIAVRVMRDQLEFHRAEAAKNGREIDPGLRFLGMLLADETDDGTKPARED